MSIRYTLRHNIPSANLAEEDVNDSSTWDLNLLRKHELAETDNHDIVYRKHNGEVVNWAEAATQQANDILGQVQDLSAHIDNQVDIAQAALQTVQEQAATLTEEAEQANEAAQTALVQANLAISSAEQSANNAESMSQLSRDWAVKIDGLVGDEDYSSKYYAQQSASSAQSSANSATQAETAKQDAINAATTAAQDAAENAVEDAEQLLSEYVTSAQTSANTATTKADEASASASDALQAKDDAVSAKNTAVEAKTSATNSATSASNSASSASTSASSASSSASSARNSASSATNAATTATTKATEASESATSAAQSATSASDSANTATSAATSATQSATDASASATSAQASATSALSAKEDAENSADLSRDWAIKMDGKVSNEDYSSKYYAGQAQSAASTAAQDAADTAASVAATQAASEVRTQLAQYVTDTTDAADRAEQALEEIDTIIEGGGYLPVTGGTINGDLSVTGTITGNLTGNATKDGSGNVITSTYVSKTSADYLKSASQSGNTLTLKKGNNATVTYTPTIPTKVSDLTNDSGYISGVAWEDVTSKPTFATVATSGSYTDLSDKPTIPTIPTNHVTTDTDQDISGVKTFLGQKKIKFKQSSANDKLGFTLFSSDNTEKGYLEYNPTGKIDGYPVMAIGNYATTADGISQVGFRRYSNISGQNGAYNILTPLISDARSPFNLTTTYTNFYMLLGATDGTSIVKVDKRGVLDLSSLLPTVPSSMTASEASTGTGTTARTISAKVLSDLIDERIAAITDGDGVSY